MISQWSSSSVEEGDSLPEYICQACLKSMQTAFWTGQSHKEGHHVKEEITGGEEDYRMTDIQGKRSHLVQVKAETPEDTENYEFLVKNEPIVDELSEPEAYSEKDPEINEKSDQDLPEKGIDVHQYRTTNKKRPAFQSPDCSKSFAFPSDIKRHFRSHERKLFCCV